MDIFQSCIANKHRSKFTITGSTVMNYCTSPFLIWCDAFAPPEEREPQTRYIHLLFERGIEHEKKVREALFETGTLIPFGGLEEGFARVINEAKKGTHIILSAPLFFLGEDIMGIPDVLMRDDSHSSVFGSYHYTIKEIKSAKHIKHQHIMQAAFYNYLIGKIQGYTPPRFSLINREKEERFYEYEKCETEIQLILQDIKEIFAGKEVSPTAKACKWPWEAYGNKRAIEANDVSIIPQVGLKLKKELNAKGIFTVKQLATQPLDLDLAAASIEKLKRYANAWLEKTPIWISKPKLKKSKTELFLDFEGTDELDTEEGMMKVDYLIGILKREENKTEFIPFVAHALNEEERMFKTCVDFLNANPDAPIYHYGPYEKTHIAALGQKYKVKVSHILNQMVDVLSLVKKHVAFPTLTMSLKEVSKFLGFSYRGMADAQESIVLYLLYLDTKEKEVLQRILDYNEDDVRATMVIKDFLSQ